MIWVIVLVLITAALFMVPFVPSIYEWKKKTDAEPLDANSSDRTVIDHISRLFREFINTNFAMYLNKTSSEKVPEQGRLSNGTEFVISAKEGDVLLSSAELGAHKTDRVIITRTKASLPNDVSFHNKVYSTQTIQTGKKNNFISLLSEDDIYLSSSNTLQRFLYSEGSIKVMEDCKLNGYVKAGKTIQFSGNSEFQCLYAPTIEFGESNGDARKEMLRAAVDVFGDTMTRKIVPGNLTIPENSQVIGHQVIKGSLTVNDHATIKGNIKVYNSIRLGKGCRVIGALVCEGDIFISNDCVIQGPIISANSIAIGKNCVIGTAETPTSLVAQNIKVAAGTISAGLFFAKSEGFYLQ